MDRIAHRVVQRFLEAKKHRDDEIVVYNKKLDRTVWVAPDTLKSEPGTYERIPKDEEHHVETRGKPKKPAKPARPRKPAKPEIPRAVTPAPVKPADPPKPVKPVPELKPVPPVKPVKPPTPPKPRRWQVEKPDAYHKVAGVRCTDSE